MSAQKTKGPVFDPGLCRCCGAMRKCRLLNVVYESHGLKELYSEMFMDCFSIMLSHLDSKPTERLVCAMCVNRLRDALAFRRQVLDREEAFLNMKMFDNVDKDPQPTEVMLFEIDTKITPVVKLEPSELSDGDTQAGNADSHADDDMQADNDVIADSTTDTGKAIEKKIKTEKRKHARDDVPLLLRKSKTLKVRWKTRSELQRTRVPYNVASKTLVAKPQLPMSKVQQLIRERDPTYMMETNLLTIVEYSYVCPFKCRHNHLLCFYCGEDFLDPKLLREHTSKCHHPKKFKITEHKNMLKLDLTRIDCRLCDEKINNLEDFKQHINKVHSKNYYFNHKDSVLPFRLTKDEYKCAVCEMGFAYFHALNKHMNVHFSNYVCETCGLGFVDKGRFVMHQQRHEESDFPCEVCGKVFKAQYNKDLHVDRVHKKRGRVYCPKCDIKLMSYPQKLKHLVEVHGEEPLSFPCNMCDKIYYTRRSLTIHRRKDHLNDYRYECNCCGQKFFTRFALNNHMPTHTGERNFKCKVCEKSYPRLKTLKDHMRIHTNDRRYRCHICGQAFIQNCSLKGHMKSQHPEYG